MRLATLFLLLSTALLGQIPAPTVNTVLFGREGNNHIPVTVGQIIAQANGNVAVSVGSTISGNGTTGSPLQLAQQGATTNQGLVWNGSSFSPANMWRIGSQEPLYNYSDFNSSSIPSGFVSLTTVINAPEIGRGNGFYLMSTPLATGFNDFVYQRAVPIGGEAASWRVNIGGAWTGWKLETGNFGNYVSQYKYSDFNTQPEYGWTCLDGINLSIANAPIAGARQWFRLRTGFSTSSPGYDYEMAIDRPVNSGSGYLWNRFKEAGSYTGWEKAKVGLADVSGNINLAASTGQVLRSTGGTSWAPSAGFTLSATGVPTSTGLSGTGDRIPVLDAAGTLYRSSLDPNNLFQRNAAYTATATGRRTTLKWDGSNWGAGVEPGNWGRNETFGSFTSFAAAEVEGISYVFNPAGGGTPIVDQPPPTSQFGAWFVMTAGIGSNYAISDYNTQIAFGCATCPNKGEMWQRWKDGSTYGAWVRLNDNIFIRDNRGSSFTLSASAKPQNIVCTPSSAMTITCNTTMTEGVEYRVYDADSGANAITISATNPLGIRRTGNYSISAGSFVMSNNRSVSMIRHGNDIWVTEF